MIDTTQQQLLDHMFVPGADTNVTALNITVGAQPLIMIGSANPIPELDSGVTTL